MKKNFEIPRLVKMDKKDFQKFEEDERSGDIDQYFTKMQLANLSAYETLRYRNMKKNYEMMVKMGLPAQKPEFMKALKQKQIVKNTNESGFNEIRKRSAEKVKRNQGQTDSNLSKSKLETKKKKKVTQRIDSDSDEEWRPSSEKRKRNSAFEVPKKRIRKEKKEQNSLNSEDENVRGVSVEREETGQSGRHRYPQRKIPLTNYMYLEVPDDDEFIYCEDCEREYEGDCLVHPCINIFDSQTTTKNERRAINTLPDGLSVKESRIPNAGLGVFADKTFPSRSKFGPYQGEITKDAETAHYTGYAWQIYLDGAPNYFIDALDKSKSNWMRYVNCARNEDEQNLIAYQYKGDIYYRCFKDIEPGNELLVWYGQDYGKDLGIERMNITSILKPKYINGEAIYRCPLCTVSFSHERYVSNHLKYHHSTKLEWLLNPLSSKTNIIVQYQCGICSMSFCVSSFAKQHHKICHGKDIMENIIRIHKLQNEDSSSSVHRSNMQLTVRGQQSKEHMKSQTKEKPCKCGNCANGFCKSQLLQIHLRRYTCDKPYKFDECGKGFSQNVDLQKHMRTHSGDKPYKFDECGKGFSQNGNLQKHMRTHSGDKPYKFDECGKGFSQNGDLQKHMRTHSVDEPYKCDECGKGFSRNDSLQTHMRTHSCDKPYKCDECGKGFSQSQNLQRHMRTHSGDKPYKCDECGKGFSVNQNLQTHMRTHSGDKPYKCDECGKGFSVNQNLQTHMRTHSGNKPYKCDECGKGFSVNQNLQTHMRTHSGNKPYKCDECGKGFSRNDNLQTHMRTHSGDKPYKCDECGKGFSESGNLQKHMRTHSVDKPYKCDECGKGFSQSHCLQTHMRTHTGDKPYKCDECGKGFSESGNLQKHMRTHSGDKP
ncbi:zinc finger protein 665-like [Mytilus californianus]|uniref:zinc finger protein 665-like n=1 Tax=Mytilus californianus TaxID=6549 RepID=UPI002247A075|nr:zinc finger protein 665-like [Mytilus californianus]